MALVCLLYISLNLIGFENLVDQSGWRKCKVNKQAPPINTTLQCWTNQKRHPSKQTWFWLPSTSFQPKKVSFIPLFYYPLFFSLTGWVQGLTVDATIERAQTTIFPLLKRNWAFWLPVQYFQFGYVDEPLQIPFLCLVGLIWTFIFSPLQFILRDKPNQSSMIFRPVFLTVFLESNCHKMLSNTQLHYALGIIIWLAKNVIETRI